MDCILTTLEVAETTSCTSVTIAAPRQASLWDRPVNVATPRQVSLWYTYRASLGLEASWLDVCEDKLNCSKSYDIFVYTCCVTYTDTLKKLRHL